MYQKYENGLLDGFLAGRAAAAERMSVEAGSARERLAWLDSSLAFYGALTEYYTNGDSPKVSKLTDKGMRLSDKALRYRKA